MNFHKESLAICYFVGLKPFTNHEMEMCNFNYHMMLHL